MKNLKLRYDPKAPDKKRWSVMDGNVVIVHHKSLGEARTVLSKVRVTL